MLLFNTTDDASNMKLLSKLLGHQRIDCTAHCMHLLLTVDSFNRIPELVMFAEKCKQIVQTLHFKGHLIRSEQAIADDIEMLERVASVIETLLADEDNLVSITESEVGDDDDAVVEHRPDQTVVTHQHHSLKASLCSR